MEKIAIMSLPMPFRLLGTVNCYLVETSHGFVLIDTSASTARDELERELVSAGCKPGNLDLIILTHGDFDHTGNAAYLRDKFGAKIAMHKDDVGMAEQGDMFWNRSSGSAIFRLLAPLLFRFAKANRFTPDIYLEEGCDLSEYGFHAHVISIPGHSRGSVGIMTSAGALFCGDLLENTKEPASGSIIDDAAASAASIEKVAGFEIETVYPGHGSPFAIKHFTASQRES